MLLHNQNLHQPSSNQNSANEPTQKITKNSLDQQKQNLKSQQYQWKGECISLQKLLKQQHSLLWTQNEQKQSFQKKLSQTISAYYKNKIQSLSTRKNPFAKTKSKENKIVSKIKQTFQLGDSNKNLDSKKNININKDNQQKILLQDEGFGDSCFYIKQILLTLSKDPQLMLTLIRRHQAIGYSQNLQSVVKSIVHSMYENIVDDDIYNKDLFIIINQAFKIIVASAKNYTDIKLKQDKSIASLIAKQFLRKTEILNYSKQVIRNMVLQIYKIDHQVSFNSDQNQKTDKNSKDSNASLGNLRLKKLQSTRNQNLVKDQKINPKSKIQNANSKINQYAQALQVKDEKMKLNRSHSQEQKQKTLRTNNKKCMSKQLLKYMGITEEIQFPTFVSSSANTELKKQEEINKQYAAMLNQKQSQSQINHDIILIKNIVLIFFSDLFKMLYTLPLSLRIACKMFYEHLQKKFGSKKGCFYVIAQYVLGLCVIKNLEVQENPDQKQKTGNHLKSNLATFSKIIMNVIRNDFKNIPRSFEYEFNLIVSNLRISLFNYMTQIINIDSSKISRIISNKVQNKQNLTVSYSHKIKSYSVCVSISDIKRLFQMIKICKTDLVNVNKNDKLIKRIERIQMVSEGKDIFLQREDKRTRTIYRPENAYVMFYELELPKQLNANFIKYHDNYFKVDKFKKMMKMFLLSIKNLEYFSQFHMQQTLFGFLNQLSQKPKSYYKISSMIENIDHVPIQVKVKYLVSLIKNNYSQNEYGRKLYELVSLMYKQVVERMEYYKSIWDQSKQSYLKALSSVIYLNHIITNTENIIVKNIKNKKLDQFIAKTKIAVCLTSPKTRQKDIVSKTNIVKDLVEEQKSKIWLQNQSRCIHTALNLQFIKSLTGQLDKMKKQDSHCNTIIKFADVLCSLPQIKQNVAEDIGVKQAFFEFIKYCADLVVKNQQYASFGEDIQWLQQSFEQKLSKKIYDRLYPKDPSYEDVAFYLRLKTLDFISYSHLKIKSCLRNDKMWELAGRQLRMMDKVKTASQKLNCINECNKIIVNSYHLINDSDEPASAQDIFPLVVYVLIKAAPKRMISNMTQILYQILSFIEYFASQNRLMSKQGYAYTQLKSAIQFIDLLTQDGLQYENMTASEKTVQFRKTIYQKEIQYGIYFLLLRKNTSHQVDNKNIKFLKDFFSNITNKNQL